MQRPKSGVLAPGGPSAQAGNRPPCSPVKETTFDQESLCPLCDDLEADHRQRGSVSRRILIFGPNSAKLLNLGQVVCPIGVAVVLHNARQTLCLHLFLERWRLVNGPRPLCRSVGPEPNFPIGKPATVSNPLATIVGHAVYFSDPQKPFRGVHVPLDELLNCAGASCVWGLIGIEAQNPLPFCGSVCAVLGLRPTFPCAVYHTGAPCLSDFHGAIGASRIKYKDFVGPPRDSLEQARQVVRLIQGDDHHAEEGGSIRGLVGGHGRVVVHEICALRPFLVSTCPQVLKTMPRAGPVRR